MKTRVHRLEAQLGRKLAAVVAGGTLALCACTSQGDLRRAELAALAGQLPGEYRNPEQALMVLRLAAPMVGDAVYYVRETKADDARRVISERIWTLDVAADARILGVSYALDEPERWHGGADNPELFRSLLLRDLRLLPGCELLWVKDARGFTGSGTSAQCPQSWRLEGDALSFGDPAAPVPPAGDGYFHLARVIGGAP